eukprot:8923378-Alexandrium_andersonii.AAC.1
MKLHKSWDTKLQRRGARNAKPVWTRSPAKGCPGTRGRRARRAASERPGTHGGRAARRSRGA